MQMQLLHIVYVSNSESNRYSYNTPQVRFMTSHKTKPDSRQPSQSLNRFFTLINIGKYTPSVPTSVPTRRTPRRVGEAIGRKVAPIQRHVLFSSPFVILTWTNPIVGQKNVYIYVSPVDFQGKDTLNKRIYQQLLPYRIDGMIHTFYSVVTYVSSYSSFSCCTANSTTLPIIISDRVQNPCEKNFPAPFGRHHHWRDRCR